MSAACDPLCPAPADLAAFDIILLARRVSMTEGRADGDSSGARLLRTLRLQAGYSQERLAKESSMTSRAIRGLESGTISKPRQSSLQRVAAALGLQDAAKQRFFAAWGASPADRLVRSVDQMVQARSESDPVPAAVRGRIDRCATPYVRFDAVISDRCIIREDKETITVPVVPDVSGTVYVNTHGLNGATPRMYGVEGCVISGTKSLANRLMLFEIDFGRRLDVGEPHRYCTSIDYGMASANRRADQAESNLTVLGFHRAALACVIRVHFEPADLPRKCFRVFTEHMRQTPIDHNRLTTSQGGIAEIVLVEPSAGWHGIRWEW